MKRQFLISFGPGETAVGFASLIGLYIVSRYSYPLFHTLVELFSILIGFSLFMLIWNSRRIIDNNYLLFIGIAYCFVAGIDLVHTLSYRGLDLFAGYGGTNLTTQLWIAARYVESIALLAAPYFIGRKLRTNWTVAGFALLALILLASIFYRLFPDCYIDGIGLTRFKIVSEYVISVILSCSLFLLIRKRTEFDREVLFLVGLSIMATIGSELAFTFYFGFYDFSNLTGHFLKVVSFYLIYKAIIQTGLTKPYSLLFRNLKQHEEALSESEARVRSKMHSILSPEGDLGTLELADIIDAQALQQLMDSFNRIAHIPMAILDVKGRILVGAGWQEICTKFHRAHPDTCRYCVESDIELSAGVAPGAFKLYRCKNNMWDIATPIMVGGQHLGNLFVGQFFFEDEEMDYGIFRSQARRYGFNEEKYIAALDRVPRLSRESVDTTMAFFLKLSEIISQLSYSNIKLARSLTERDRLADSLKEQKVQLEDANKELEDFSYTVSHDLRAPLRAIDGYSRLLLRDEEAKLEEHSKHRLRLIRDNVGKMGQLIDDLLSLSRLGHLAMSWSIVDMNDVVNQAWKELRDINPDRRMELKMDGLPQARGDRALVKQVLSNLIANAVKFTRSQEEAVIEFGGKNDGNENVYYVKDNGVGFDMRYYDKLFGVFQTLHGAQEYEGTGVGLAIVHRIITRHGGRVWAEGKVDEGATFYFTLPGKGTPESITRVER